MAAAFSGALLLPSRRTQSLSNGDSVWGRRTQVLPSLSWKKSSEIEIVLDGENEFIHTYTTFDQIKGHVNLTFEKDTCIDDFAITFQGQTSTWVEKAVASPTLGRTTGLHTFLRVHQPIDQRCLPEYNKALAGQVYSIPFEFVVPDRTLDFACSHKVEKEEIKDSHLLLPPSIGDPMQSGQGNMLMDDLAPTMSKIAYAIQVRLLKASPTVRKPEIIREDRKISIIPAREEAPPLTIDLPAHARNGRYCLRKEKDVRKGILRIGKKIGRLTAETQQPASLKLHPPSRVSDEPVATMTTVQLRYDPASADEKPPSLSSISNKLKAYTFYGAAAWTYHPAPEGYDVYSTLHSQFPECIDLSSRNLSNVEWTKHEPGSASTNTPTPLIQKLPDPNQRRDSKATSTSIPTRLSTATQASRPAEAIDLLRRESTFSSTSSTVSSKISDQQSASSFTHSLTSSSEHLPNQTPIPAPSESFNATLPYYTTSIVVPITLPTSQSNANANTNTSNPSSTTPTLSPNTSRRASTASTNSTTNTTTHKPRNTRHKPILFLPTFHTCLVSRIYSLELSISTQSGPTMTLRVPIQLSLPYTHNHPSPSSTLRPQIQTWSNPFAHGDDDNSADIDVQNDEAIARALASVPEYEDLQTGNDDMQARHASLPVLRPGGSAGVGDEAPPDYDSMFRRISARRNTVQVDVNADANPNANASDGGVGQRSTAEGNGNRNGATAANSSRNEKSEGRRRFSLRGR